MMDKIIDGMKMEGKIFRNIMIAALGLFLLTFVYMYVNDKSLQDIQALSRFLVLLIFAILGLYGWLYSIKYKVEIDEELIVLETLFRKVEIKICDIEEYSCNRYKKSKFYQFNLFINGKKVLVNTRYKDEFETILKKNGIEQFSH